MYMSETCSGLSLYDPTTGSLTNWGETLAALYDGGTRFGNVSASDDLCRREGADPENIPTTTKQQLERADQYRDESGLPVVCPHDPHPASDVCPFHMDDSQRADLNISDEDVEQQALATIVDNDARNGPGHKKFVNVSLPQFNVKYDIINTDDNYPLDFRFAKIESLILNNSVFHEKIRFAKATIEKCECQSTHFERGVSFSGAKIKGDKSDFSNAEFGSDSTFADTTFVVGQISFRGALFHDDISFNGGQFCIDTDVAQKRKRNESDTVDIDFRQTRFEGDGDFKRIDLTSATDNPQKNTGIQVYFRRCKATDGDISFKNTEFGSADVVAQSGIAATETENPLEVDTVSFKRTDFGDSNVEFTKMETGGDLKMSDIKLEGNKIEFNQMEVDGEFDLTGAILSGDDVLFNRTVIGGDAYFRRLQSENVDKLNFDSVDFRRNVYFDDSRISATSVQYSGVTISGRATFNRTEFNCRTIDYTDITVKNPFSAVNVSVRCNQLTFDDATFEDAFSLPESTLTGDVSFDSAKFNCQTVDLSKSDASGATLSFEKTQTNNPAQGKNNLTVIDFTNSVVSNGEFVQPDENDTYYDFTRAKVGDINLSLGCCKDQTNLFSYFKFRETEFDGFDFSDSRYRRALKRNSWCLHAIGTEKPVDRVKDKSLPATVVGLVKKYKQLATDGANPNFSPDVLESTYRKAKIGADQAGDSEASSKFFQKELGYRRQGHGYQVWTRGDGSENQPDFLERISSGWLWLTNSLLWIIAGYGERPKRVILMSLVTVGLFAGIYDILWFLFDETPPEALGDIAGSLILSAEAFTAIILGGSSVDNNVIRIFNYIEGFIGSLFIALFVLTVTRAVRR